MVLTPKEARRKLGLKQAQMRALIGCSQSQLSKVENGKEPRAWTWDQYMKPLGYPTREDFAAGLRKARRLRALRTPAAKDFPLGQHAQGAGQVTQIPAPLQTPAADAGKAVNE